jgi:hypothetical protein
MEGKYNLNSRLQVFLEVFLVKVDQDLDQLLEKEVKLLFKRLKQKKKSLNLKKDPLSFLNSHLLLHLK